MKRYSLMNMRQLLGLFADLCVLSVFYQFLHHVHTIVLLWSAEQFYEHIMQELVKTGKYTEINKQSDVKLWLNWIKFWDIAYLAVNCSKFTSGVIRFQCRFSLDQAAFLSTSKLAKNSRSSDVQRSPPLIATKHCWSLISSGVLPAKKGLHFSCTTF